MNLRKDALNLNSYEWWRNHRRVVTIALFIGIATFFIVEPHRRNYIVKDTCGKLNSSYQITGNEALKKLRLKEVKDFDNRKLANFYCERYLGIR